MKTVHFFLVCSNPKKKKQKNLRINSECSHPELEWTSPVHPRNARGFGTGENAPKLLSKIHEIIIISKTVSYANRRGKKIEITGFTGLITIFAFWISVIIHNPFGYVLRCLRMHGKQILDKCILSPQRKRRNLNFDHYYNSKEGNLLYHRSFVNGPVPILAARKNN